MFSPHLYSATPRHVAVYGFYEKVYTIIDLIAGLTFLVGSILFFWEQTTHFATWLFVVGSVLFTARPTSKFVREFHLGRLPLPGDDIGN